MISYNSNLNWHPTYTQLTLLCLNVFVTNRTAILLSYSHICLCKIYLMLASNSLTHREALVTFVAELYYTYYNVQNF